VDVEGGVDGAGEAGVVLQAQQLGQLEVHGTQLVHIDLTAAAVAAAAAAAVAAAVAAMLLEVEVEHALATLATLATLKRTGCISGQNVMCGTDSHNSNASNQHRGPFKQCSYQGGIAQHAAALEPLLCGAPAPTPHVSSD